ncbi:MAG: glutamine amidotransferase [Candidatus Andersenbacteria bacterium]
MSRHLTIVWLYHDLMNLYGDRGNVLTLAHRARARGIDVAVRGVTVGEPLPSVADLVFFGGGQDQEQSLVARDLPSKRAALATLLEQGGGLLAVCGGYQLLGSYYQPHESARIAGLGLLPVHTEAGTRRMIGDLVVESEKFGTLVGFENHSGRTFLHTAPAGRTSSAPLGRVAIGSGNNGDDEYEGVVVGHAIGTYLHGPLLPKNPRLADTLIAAGLRSHGDDPTLTALPDRYVALAREQALHRAQTRRTSSLGLRS